jgi:putative transposase
MCRLLGVSKSGYYGWRDRPPSKRTLGDEVLTEKIRLVHTQSRGIYGYRRITTELVEEHDERVGRHKVARLMHAAGIQGVTRRKFCRTTRRDDRARPAPDLLGRDFTAKRPNARWVADITYVPTWAGFLFLAVVLDVFTRKVVGWSMSATQNTELVTRALQMAVARGRPDGVVVHHSDQGCQGGFKRPSQHLDTGGGRWRQCGSDSGRSNFIEGRSHRRDDPRWPGVKIGSNSGRRSVAA